MFGARLCAFECLPITLMLHDFYFILEWLEIDRLLLFGCSLHLPHTNTQSNSHRHSWQWHRIARKQISRNICRASLLLFFMTNRLSCWHNFSNSHKSFCAFFFLSLLLTHHRKPKSCLGIATHTIGDGSMTKWISENAFAFSKILCKLIFWWGALYCAECTHELAFGSHFNKTNRHSKFYLLTQLSLYLPLSVCSSAFLNGCRITSLNIMYFFAFFLTIHLLIYKHLRVYFVCYIAISILRNH